ncbi:MAG: hypothetical protein ACYCZR_01070 [Burkholderiales bacterium]
MAKCRWVQDGVGESHWDTDCRHRFTINEGTPSENHMAFCCYCGKPLVEIVDLEKEEREAPMTDHAQREKELDGMAALIDAVHKQEWPHTMDPELWARAYNDQRTFEGKPTEPVGDLIPWFSNAIMAGYDTACSRIASDTTQAHAQGWRAGMEESANGLENEIKYAQEDEAYDNEVGRDGDGTSYNQGVAACIQWIRAQAKEAGHD